ncbi:MAG: hypothetical protein Q4E78_05340 [Eubacteriales bacterium]|nr:hypothetical protein [Eubacteriales bacterium]
MKLFRKKFTFFPVMLMIAALVLPSVTAMAADSSYKFSAIDLKLNVPEELICFTQTTTGNNAYLKDIGADDANEVQNAMRASNIYLEAFSKDLSYEIAVVGIKAGSSLSNLDELSQDELSGMFLNYIDSENSKQEDSLTETMTGKAIDTINDRPYFRTEVTSVSDEKQTIYTRKYYTVTRGYIYMYSLQSKDNEITEDMVNDILHIINSAQYTSVKKSIFENGVFTETLSSILTVAIPIAILVAIYLLITKVGKKGRSKLSSEEAELRARYKEQHNKK